MTNSNYITFVADGESHFCYTDLLEEDVLLRFPGATGFALQATPFIAHATVGAIKKVNLWRTKKETGGFNFAGKTWQSDALSAQRIMGAAILAANNPAYSQTWTAADNSGMALDQAGIQGLFAALGAHVAATFATAKAAKDAINAATTVTQIDAALAILA